MNLLQGKWPRLATLLAVLVAAALVFLAWERYTRTPWTRDARVRADVVTLSADDFRQLQDQSLVSLIAALLAELPGLLAGALEGRIDAGLAMAVANPQVEAHDQALQGGQVAALGVQRIDELLFGKRLHGRSPINGAARARFAPAVAGVRGACGKCGEAGQLRPSHSND